MTDAKLIESAIRHAAAAAEEGVPLERAWAGWYAWRTPNDRLWVDELYEQTYLEYALKHRPCPVEAHTLPAPRPAEARANTRPGPEPILAAQAPSQGFAEATDRILG